jgi:carbon storage regulator CsrA
MLVLARKPGEVIVLSRGGVEIGRVMVVDVKGTKVRLGMQFADDVTIDRLEIHEAKKEQRDADRQA